MGYCNHTHGLLNCSWTRVGLFLTRRLVYSFSCFWIILEPSFCQFSKHTLCNKCYQNSLPMFILGENWVELIIIFRLTAWKCDGPPWTIYTLKQTSKCYSSLQKKKSCFVFLEGSILLIYSYSLLLSNVHNNNTVALQSAKCIITAKCSYYVFGHTDLFCVSQKSD